MCTESQRSGKRDLSGNCEDLPLLSLCGDKIPSIKRGKMLIRANNSEIK